MVPFLQAGRGQPAATRSVRRNKVPSPREAEMSDAKNPWLLWVVNQNISVLKLSLTFFHVLLIILSFYLNELELDFCCLQHRES